MAARSNQAKSQLGLKALRLSEVFRRYKHTYKNYDEVLFKAFLNSPRITAVLKNGTRCENLSRHDVGMLSMLAYHSHSGVNYDAMRQLLTFDFHEKRVRLFDGLRNGEVVQVFSNEIYKWLDAEGQTVVDIGANIGDSTLYFALNGARKVFAFEPYPYSYKWAVRNIVENGVAKNVTLINAAVGGQDGRVVIDPNFVAGTCATLREYASGISIPVLSLKTIVNKHKISSAVLKMDCEGCEHDAIINTDQDILKRFTRMQIEYHHDYEDLRAKLEESGFNLSISKPRTIGPPHLFVGFVFATQEPTRP